MKSLRECKPEVSLMRWVLNLSVVWLATPGSSVIRFHQQGYWSGLPVLSPGDIPDPGVELMSLASPALSGGFFTTALPGKLPGAGILHIRCILHIAYWVQHIPKHHLSGSGIAQLEFYHCRKPAWGTPPMTKVMRKEARHTQRRDRASGVSLEILEQSTPKTRVCLLSALCFHLHLWFTGGCPPLPLSEKKS